MTSLVKIGNKYDMTFSKLRIKEHVLSRMLKQIEWYLDILNKFNTLYL